MFQHLTQRAVQQRSRRAPFSRRWSVLCSSTRAGVGDVVLCSSFRKSKQTRFMRKGDVIVTRARFALQQKRSSCVITRTPPSTQASEVRAQRQPCSAAASVFALRSVVHGRVAEQTAALLLLKRLLVGGLCVGPRGGGDRTKLGECLARRGDVLFGERLHGFDV